MDDHLPHRFVFVFGLLFGGSSLASRRPSRAGELRIFAVRTTVRRELYACQRNGQTGDDLPASLTASYVAIAEQAANDKQFQISRAKIDKAAGNTLDPQRQQLPSFPTRPCTALCPTAATAAIWAARLWSRRR